MRRTVWLLIAAIMAVCIHPCVAYETEENPVLYQTDFEDFRKNYFPGLDFSKPLLADTVVVDKEHQKSLKMSGNNLIYYPDKTLTEGSYRVSFDFYDTLAGKTNYLRTVNDRANSLSSLGNLCETFVANPKGMGYYKGQKGWVMSDHLMQYTQNRWYHIDIWFDFDQKAVYYYVDQERLGVEKMSNLTKIDGLIFQMEGNVYLDNLLIQKITNPEKIEDAPAEFAYMAENNLMSIKIASEATGNVFFDQKTPTLMVNMTNTSSEKTKWDAQLQITDTYNRIVWEKEITGIEIEVGETVSEAIATDITKFGIYNVKLILRDGLHTIVRYSEFSLVRTPEKGVKNEKIAIGTHIAQRKTADDFLIDTMVKFVDKAGFSSVRDECYWSDYEAPKGVFTMQPRYTKYVERLNRNNIETYQLLGYGNTNYMNNGDWHPTLPWQIDAFSEYCYRLVSEQKGKVRIYEVYNEWTNIKHTPEEYAVLLPAAYKAIKRANPDAEVVGMCPAGTQPNWIEKVLIALNGEKCFDSISIHPYCFPGSPERALAYNVGQVRDLMNRYGYGDMKLYGSEYGFPVTAAYNTEIEQAVYGVLYYCVNDADHLMDRIYWYDLQNDGWDAEEMENNFGMIRSWTDNGNGVPFAAKPAYLATAQYNAMVAGGKIEGRIANDKVSLYHYKQSSGRDVLITTAKNAKNQTLSLELGTDKVSLYDMYGNEREIYGINGRYTFMINNTISYIAGDFKEIKECSPVVSLPESVIACIDGSTDSFSIFCGEGKELTAQGTQNVVIERVEDFSNERAAFVYKTVAKPKENEKAAIEIKDGYRTLFYAELPLVSSSSVTVEGITVKPYSLKDITHWMAEITLKNNSSFSEKSGEIIFSSPLPIKDKIGRVTFSNLAAKSQKKMYIHFPGGIRSMSSLEAVIKTDSGEEIAIREKLETDTAKRVDIPPVIDGNLDEWDFNGGMFAEDEDTVTAKEYKGLSDLSGKAKVMWDDENMYFAAEITDDVLFFYNGEDPWNIWGYDSIQLGIASSRGTKVMTELGLALTGAGPVVYGYTFEKEGINQGVIKNAQLEVKRAGFKTYYEACIPWKEFLPEEVSLKRGTNIYFSMLLNDNDNDGNGRGFMEYGSGIATDKTAALFIKTLLY